MKKRRLFNAIQSFCRSINQRTAHIKSQAEAGFTLIEMMIVLAIIALVMGFVGTKVIKRFEEAKINATKIQIKQILVILDDFKRVCSFYPTTEQGLDALVHAPVGGRQCKNYDPEGFLKKVPQDAWNNDFVYISDGNKDEIKSLGPEGKEGTPGVISSNDLD
jgi:general secretion pathway protein G